MENLVLIGWQDYSLRLFKIISHYWTFVDLGFKEVERRSPKRPMMRYYLDEMH